jgi:hypothetical protein
METREYDKLGELLQTHDYADGLINRRLNVDLYRCLTKIFGLAFHEYTHFIDSTSTVWGIDYLNILNAAYLTNHELYGTRETEFYKAKQLVDFLKSVKLPSYYTSVEKGADIARPWQHYLSVGRRFDFNGYVSNTPIPFISFLTTDNKRIARSPISLIALLEISATAQEFLYKTFLLNALPEDVRLVEKYLVERDALSFMYNPNLTEYTGCAHLVANALGIPDILQSYTTCERISTLVLNLTSEHFDRLNLSKSARELLKFEDDPDFEDATYKAIKNKDRGFVFLLICRIIGSFKSEGNIELSLQKTLTELGLHYFQVIVEARRHVEIKSADLKNSPYAIISKISCSALKNFDQKVSATNGMYDFSKFNLPPALFGDGEVRNVCPGIDNLLKDFDILGSYDELIEGQRWVEKFSEACG